MSAKRTQFALDDLVGLRNADDDMVLEVAVNGQADAIVTLIAETSGRRQSGSGLKSCCPARRSNDWEEYHEEE